jgi:quercetin dioxygenase-like cupin family protein
MEAARDTRAEDQAAVAYVLEEGEGETIRWFGSSLTVKASGPRFDVAVRSERAGSESPVHAHADEDKAIFVLQGALTVFAGEEVLRAPTGAFVFLPRTVPHTFVVDSGTARMLVILGPSGSLCRHGRSVSA